MPRSVPSLTRVQALVRLIAALAGSLVIWPAIEAVLPPVYSHGRHVASAVLTALAVGALWFVLTRAVGERTGPQRGDGRRAAIGALAYLVPTGVAFAVVLGTGLATVQPRQSLPAMLGQGMLLLALVVLS